MKDSMMRCFAAYEADPMMKQTMRVDWPVFLHNLCYLHGSIRLRARLGRGGFNSPQDFLNIGNPDFQV